MTTIHALHAGTDAPKDRVYAAADMRADWCNSGAEVCDIATTCTGCDKTICPDHCDEFTSCVGNVDLKHCLDCEGECVECRGAGAEDDYEDRYESDLRGDVR